MLMGVLPIIGETLRVEFTEMEMEMAQKYEKKCLIWLTRNQSNVNEIEIPFSLFVSTHLKIIKVLEGVSEGSSLKC